MKKGYHILLFFATFLFFSCENNLLLQEVLSVGNTTTEGISEKNRNSKAKIEYSINEKRNRQQGDDYPFMMYVHLNNDTLVISYSGELKDANILISKANKESIIIEDLVLINKDKTNKVYPSDSFPYYIEIHSPDADIKGSISLVDEEK